MTATKRDDGGPAYPVSLETACSRTTYPGMTLRDWFAGQALAGMASTPGDIYDMQKFCEYTYDIADAMLAARKKET